MHPFYVIINNSLQIFPLIKNISAGGIFTTTDKSQYVGHEVSFEFRLVGYEKPIRVFGKIVRSDHYGFAVKFYEKVEKLLNSINKNKND